MSNTATATVTGGYQCTVCHQWVPTGVYHSCTGFPAGGNITYPQPVYTLNYIDLTTLIKSIEELKDTVKELANIVEKQQ